MSFDLTGFVAAHFDPPARPEVDYRATPGEDVQSYIGGMWNVLRRSPDQTLPYSSLLPLPYPYVVPGGRFIEIYYWDSYFTMMGLEHSDRDDMAVDLVKNFASLIDSYGHVPNGNRSYYLSRSQPPFFSSMVALIAAHDGDAVYTTYLPELMREHDFWMEGATDLPAGQTHRRVVRLADGTLLNRYWDDRADPRDESYREDVETARGSNRAADDIYRNLRAAAESGWDFSSRWFADGTHLTTIETTSLAPVDLNCLLVHLEQTIAKAYRLQGNAADAERFDQAAAQRTAAIRRLMWDADAGAFVDYDWTAGQRSQAVTAATLFPLFFGVASDEQAKAVAATVRQSLLQPGGLATTRARTGQQWDQPNGWAPLQWIAVSGLSHYGEDELAKTIAERWVRKNVACYQASASLVEKYDLTTDDASNCAGSGGEYRVQVGFGWTNGVLLQLLALYPTAVSSTALPAAAPRQ